MKKSNKYISVCRKEKRNYEKNIIDKCKDQPNSFYQRANWKLKNRVGINKLQVGVVYEEAGRMVAVMNNCFQKVFTRESGFQEQNDVEMVRTGLSEINVMVQEVRKLMEDQDIRKATGPDRVSNWILKECSQQLAEKIH